MKKIKLFAELNEDLTQNPETIKLGFSSQGDRWDSNFECTKCCKSKSENGARMELSCSIHLTTGYSRFNTPYNITCICGQVWKILWKGGNVFVTPIK